MNKETHFLSPSIQDCFWGALDPDIRGFLDAFESKETWTYAYSELPSIFISLASALPKFAHKKPDASAAGIVQKLIPILSSMPLRQCIAAISWLDNHSDDASMGWGVYCYMSVSDIIKNRTNDPLYTEAKTVFDRIEIILKSSISCMLFTQILTR